MLRHGQEYVDAGAEYYESQYQQRALRAAKRRASQLGYQLVPMSDAQHHEPTSGRRLKNRVSREETNWGRCAGTCKLTTKRVVRTKTD